MRSHLAPPDRGFTLIELLVVVAIMGMLASIGISVFLRQRDGAWEATVANDLRAAGVAQYTHLSGSIPEAFATSVPELVAAGFTPSAPESYAGRTFAMSVSGVGSQRFCMTARAANGMYVGYGSAVGLVKSEYPLDPATCS